MIWSRISSAAGRALSFVHHRKKSCAVILSIECGLLVLGCIVAIHWPYRYREIHPLLIQVFGSQVKVTHYRRVYLPHPGFIATGIAIIRPSAPHQPPFGTVETLYVQGEWNDLLLLRRRVHMVEMTGVHIIIPAAGSPASREEFPAGSASGFSGPSTAIELLRLHNSILEVQYDSGKSLRFAIRSLELKNLEQGHAIDYVLDMENPQPAGHISATGTFGPLNTQDVGATQVSGKFTFNQVKLSDIGELHGTLASTGRFSGPLRAIEASAISDTPDFAVADGQPTHVSGAIRCTVNGINGDVFLNRVEVNNGHTTIRAHGQIAGSPKTANVDLAVDQGRAEEILRPFMHQNPPVIGTASLESHAFVGPAGKPFLQRLRVEGQFDLPGAKDTDARVERSLSAFSARQQNPSAKADANPLSAQSPDPPSNQAPRQTDVLSSLAGPITIRQGVIATPGLRFQVPGAHVQLHGTFSLNDESVHLLGNLKMDAGISHATTGWKSVLIKPFSPFFKRKRRAGSEIPIAVTGKPGRYRVTQDISHTK
jgi:hypothetical protein